MYVSGHILTSVLVAKLGAKSVNLGFGITAAIMIATSLIDADHLFYYYLDDGTASSFALHPLHRFWYLVVGTALVSTFVFKRARPYLIAVFMGLALHFMMDYVADRAQYDLLSLAVLDVVAYVVTLILVKFKRWSVVFLTASLIVPYGVNGFLLYGLDIAVDSSPIYHIATIIMLSVAALFARKALK